MTDASATRGLLADSGIDGLALKPTEVDVAAVADGTLGGADTTSTGTTSTDAAERRLADATVVIDFEGQDAVPDASTLTQLAERVGHLRVTTPVRADGFDPLGDDAVIAGLPAAVRRVLVAGHPAYLDDHERQRAIAPRLETAVESADDPWVGTEGVERLALAAGGTQFELLSPTVERGVRALRAAGYEGDVAVYAPTVLSTDEDRILDAVGDYVARRGAVADALPDGASTDSLATGEARRILSNAAREYALVGDRSTVRERTDALRDAGVDHVVAYPAEGLATLFE